MVTPKQVTKAIVHPKNDKATKTLRHESTMILMIKEGKCDQILIS